MNLSFRSTHILAVAASALLAFAALITIQPAAAEASGLIAPAKQCENASGYGNPSKARESILCLTNFARAKKGLKRYRPDSRLKRSSTNKARDILRCNQFSHEACGRPFDYWINRSGYPRCAIGENIAWGSGSLGTSREIFVAWMKSAGHRSAILDRGYKRVGIGLKSGKLGKVSGARVWVQNFGGC